MTGRRYPGWRLDQAASLLEYALLVALIATIAIVAIGFLSEDDPPRSESPEWTEQ